jgi:hypothetical protein
MSQSEWTPMLETHVVPQLEETLKGMNAVLLDEYEGIDIKELRNLNLKIEQDTGRFKPVKGYSTDPLKESYDKSEPGLKGKVVGWIRCYKADKIEKITFSFMSAMLEGQENESYPGITLGIAPKDDYALPLYHTAWDENVNYTHITTDLIPLADCARDLEYLKKYQDPLEPAWKKHKYLRDLPCEFPQLELIPFPWFRAALGPYGIAVRPPMRRADVREKFMELPADYLKIYIDMWKEAEPQDPAYMKLLNERKRTFRGLMRKNFRERSVVTPWFGNMAEKIFHVWW